MISAPAELTPRNASDGAVAFLGTTARARRVASMVPARHGGRIEESANDGSDADSQRELRPAREAVVIRTRGGRRAVAPSSGGRHLPNRQRCVSRRRGRVLLSGPALMILMRAGPFRFDVGNVGSRARRRPLSWRVSRRRPTILGVSRFRRSRSSRAEARERGPRRSEKRGQTETCREDGSHERGRAAGRCRCRGHRGRGSARPGVTRALRSLTPMRAGATDRRTPGKTGGTSDDLRSGLGRDPLAGAHPDPERGRELDRADSGEARARAGRGFDSRHLHFSTSGPGDGPCGGAPPARVDPGNGPERTPGSRSGERPGSNSRATDAAWKDTQRPIKAPRATAPAVEAGQLDREPANPSAARSAVDTRGRKFDVLVSRYRVRPSVAHLLGTSR